MSTGVLQIEFVNAANPAPGVVTATVAPTAPLTTSGVKPGAPLDLTGLFTTPVVITDTNRSTVRHKGYCSWHC